jgi:hypothetical protein
VKRLIFERLTDPVAPLPIVKDNLTRVCEHMMERYGISREEAFERYRHWEMINDFRAILGIK